MLDIVIWGERERARETDRQTDRKHWREGGRGTVRDIYREKETER